MDDVYMQSALDQAQEAFLQNEVPIGALVVDAQGTVVAQAYNQVETLGTQRAHAEMIAIEAACAVVGNWRLNNCWLYVTLEPCTMCMGFAQQSRLAGVVYGAASPRFGYSSEYHAGYGMNEQPCQSGYYETSCQIAPKITVKEGAVHTMLIVGGVKSERSQEMLKFFFNRQRSK